MCRQQDHHSPGGLPPPAVQVTAELPDLATWIVGEHADRAHTDHDLAGGWMMWQLQSSPRRGCCQRPQPCSHSGLRAELMDRRLASPGDVEDDDDPGAVVY